MEKKYGKCSRIDRHPPGMQLLAIGSGYEVFHNIEIVGRRLRPFLGKEDKPLLKNIYPYAYKEIQEDNST
jgi:hypothetical protein